MDSQTIAKTFKCNSPQTPMSNVRYSTQSNSTFKDVSFSSYLAPKDSKSNNSQENVNGDTEEELNIFDAHKYFSESNNNSRDNINNRVQQQQQEPSHDLLISVSRLSSASSVDGYMSRNFRTRSSRVTTPTASSEASWNSRTGLLSNRPGSVAVSLRNSPSDHSNNIRRSSAAKKWYLARKCCCTGGESVQVKTVTSESGRSSFTKDIMEIHHNKARISASGRPFLDGPVSSFNFTFPILKSSSDQATKPASTGINVAKSIINPPEKDRFRHSLGGLQQVMQEVPSVISRPSSMENPVNGRGPFNPGNPVAREDDMGSDASSDLFEIESFSTQTTLYPIYRRRDSVDKEPTYNYARRFASANGISNGGRSLDEPPPPTTTTPSVAGSECYPPSEVSIVWSVATSEGYDRTRETNFSVASALRQRVEEAGGGGGDGDGGKSKGNGLMLMGCRQEKAVSVGPQAAKCATEGRPPRANKPPLGSSHSARLSLAFAA